MIKIRAIVKCNRFKDIKTARNFVRKRIISNVSASSEKYVRDNPNRHTYIGNMKEAAYMYQCTT
jgi:hypothetical protein